MSRFAVAVVLTCSLAALHATASFAAEQPAGDEVDRAVKHYMQDRQIPGASVAIIQDGKLVKETSYGLASVELNVPVSDRTLFTLASTTKEFTAVAIMTLVEAGKVSLDTPVRTYLPELPPSWGAVTVRHCLAHTSGLPDGDAPDDVNVLPLAGTQADLMKLLVTRPVGEPGVKTVYNQTEYMLLGDIIERVTGKPYKTYIEDRLLKPLGITDMQWGDGWAVVPGRASLYTAVAPTPDHLKLQIDAKGQPVMSKEGIHAFGSKAAPAWLTPAAGLNGNIQDMVRWESALWSGKIITPQSLATMSAPYKLRDGSAGDFGLEFIPYPLPGTAEPSVSSGGGAAVWITTLPKSHLTAIVLTNLQGCKPPEFVIDVLQAYRTQKGAARR
ncbi:serine hydrolase domain-containing protein [Dyella acidiphila]|uniref:Beta-lactamase family protein n=1 Tax=Dyella acidiphila TaxID=2775866 RepID=A0ABR9G772_9GAMM|nr:serine hydrolase domain-containing protein [Dyella acidiphila]MBE1159896.1 beta-lactamase family protein [Dyella acidiphila]